MKTCLQRILIGGICLAAIPAYPASENQTPTPEPPYLAAIPANGDWEINLKYPSTAHTAAASDNAKPQIPSGYPVRIGTIKTGKDADLVVMTGDFTKEDSKVKWVFINGTKVEVNP